MPSNKIFISYRRGLDDDSAGRVFDRMATVFGEDKLFRDVDSSHELVGLDFHEILTERVRDCSAFVAIIGPEWINGIERLGSENDFVRIEVEAALSRSDIRVVPVLIGNLEMPRPDDLPESLRPLTRRGAIRLTNEGYSSAIEMLIGILADATSEAKGPVPEMAAGVLSDDRIEPGLPSDAAGEIDTTSAHAEDGTIPQDAGEDTAQGRDDTLFEPVPGTADDNPEALETPPLPTAKPARWIIAARSLAAVVILGVMGFWVYAIVNLYGKTERVQGLMSVLGAAQNVELERQAPNLPEASFLGSVQSDFREALQTDIDSGVVSIFGQGNTITVRVSAGGLFDAGSDVIGEDFLETFDRIARVMNREVGSVIVVGHTDNVPIRSARFPSNAVLSLARAQSVADRIVQTFDDPGRVTAEGWADQVPIASNDTRDGRAQNRRIEVLLVRSGERDDF